MSEHPAGRGLLEDVEHARLVGAAPFRGREARGRVGEVDGAVRAPRRWSWRSGPDHRRSRDRPARSRAPSAAMASSPFMASAAIIRPCASKSKPSTRPPVFAKTSCCAPSGSMRSSAAARHRRVELAVRADRDVLGAELVADVDRAQISEARVRRMRAGIARRCRRDPRHRLRGHGPEAEIGRHPHKHESRGAGDLRTTRRWSSDRPGARASGAGLAINHQCINRPTPYPSRTHRTQYPRPPH